MNHANRSAAVMVSSILLLSANGAYAQNWPQWRGPNRDAKVSGFVAPKTWPKSLTEKWKVEVGDGVATPALVGDRLYVFTRQGTEEVIRCLDATGGKQIWENKYEAKPATDPGGFKGPRSSPTVADGKVVTLGVQGVLSCLDATDGKVVWRKDTKGHPMFFTASSPIIVNGLCIVQQGGGSNGALVAYDLATGDEKWKWTGGSPAYASPELMTVDGTKLIVAETQNKIVAVNAADGKLAWETPFRTRYNASSPIVEGQRLIFVGDGATVVKIEKEDAGFGAKEVWKNKDTSVIYNTPVVINGLIFGLSNTNRIFCVNAETGKTLWTAPIGQAAGAGPTARGGQEPRGPGGQGAPGGQGRRGGRRGGMGGSGFGSIVDAGSVLMALSPSAQLIVFEPGDKEFKQLASYKVADGGTYAYPVVSGNRIYIKDKDSVILWTLD
jgi:outer membrane protein assembly factor BamB